MSKSAAAIALLVIVPAGARAFQEPALFDVLPSPITGGGGSVHYTGSPASRYYSCIACHQYPEHLVTLKWDSNPPDLTQGTYTAGATYRITLSLVGEHLGLCHPKTNCSNLGLPGQPTCNWNGVAAEIVDVNGNPVGTLCPEVTQRTNSGKQNSCTSTGSAVLSVDASQVIGQPSQFGGDTEWAFDWKAPADVEPISMFAAVVDGNGGGPVGGTPPHDGLSPDIDGDDVATLDVTWGPAAPPATAAACGYSGIVPWTAIALLLLPLRRRRA
jgi:hypothetical protein